MWSRRDDPEYFSNEYRRRVDVLNPSWRALRAVCFTLTWGRDVVCPLWRARQLDHLNYRSLGREIPLLDVVPLSVATHRFVTELRDCGFRTPVNLVLRAAAVCWATWDALLVLSVGCLVTGHLGTLFDGIQLVSSMPEQIQAAIVAVISRYR